MTPSDARGVYEYNCRKYGKANCSLNNTQLLLQAPYIRGVMVERARKMAGFALIEDIPNSRRTYVVQVEEVDAPWAAGAREQLVQGIVRRADRNKRVLICDADEADLPMQLLLKASGFWCHGIRDDIIYRFLYPKEASKKYRDAQKQNQGTPKGQGRGHRPA